MRVLLIWPKFLESYWSFEKVMEMIGKKALLPPLGLTTVAAILPQSWEFRLIDRNIEEVSEADWDWAEIVLFSAMLVQKADMHKAIKEAQSRGKPTAVGGPYATSCWPELKQVGADYLVLDEGEITIPIWLEDMANGAKNGIYRSAGEKPDVTLTPVPRFDLLDMDAYSEMSVQYSRGCPFLCEFCDIIVLYGRKPRTKTPEQVLLELEALHELGWRSSIFVVDDNFIGNKKNAKKMLRHLHGWLVDKGFPFDFSTEASIDLSRDPDLMDLMVDCNFGSVFIGIETPDDESLAITKKTQNLRDPLEESIAKVTGNGLRIMAGFIIGFDGETKGAGARIVDFIEHNNIPLPTFSMLQALPGTALWQRLEKEGRLRTGEVLLNQTSLTNFIPTRPIEDIANEYVESFYKLFDPRKFLDRTYRHFRIAGTADVYTNPARRKNIAPKPKNPQMTKVLLTIFWRQGILRKTRWVFWFYLWQMYRHNPGVFGSYLATANFIEHFMPYREVVKRQIETRLATFIETEKASAEKLTSPVEPTGSAIDQDEMCNTNPETIPILLRESGNS